MKARTSIITGTMAALLIAVVCMSAASAIATSQASYSPTALWAPGHILNYKLDLYNRIETDKGEYHPTVTMSAMVTYNITAVNGDAINITETITSFTVTYPFAFNSSHMPFFASYNQSVSKLDYLQDFAYDVHAKNVSNAFAVASHGQNQTISTLTTLIGDIDNHVVYYKNNNTVVPQAGDPEIINRFMVSANISGSINTTTKANIAGNTSTDKIYGNGIFYTPMSFASQHGTFWLNMGLDLANITDMGLWTKNLTSDQTTFPMRFTESDTYTWHEGASDEAFRWRAKFEVGYPKVSGTEQAKFDSETGILLEYYTEQTRVDANIGGSFRENVHPHALKCELTSVVGITFIANATPEVPGFPIITLLVALGIGVAILCRKFRK